MQMNDWDEILRSGGRAWKVAWLPCSCKLELQVGRFDPSTHLPYSGQALDSEKQCFYGMVQPQDDIIALLHIIDPW